MRSRRIWATLAIAVVAVAAVLVVLLTRRAPEGPYALVAWEYGAVAWVGETPDALDEIARTAADRFDEVFETWVLPPPESVPDGRVARRSDPAGGPSVDLCANQWYEALLPPLVVIVLPDRESVAEATGLEAAAMTLAYGAASAVASVEDQPQAKFADWLARLTEASVVFVCTSDGWQEQLVGETARWMLNRSTEIPELCECTPYSMPALVRAGFVAYTIDEIFGGEDRLAMARAWAAENEITTNLEDGLLRFDVDSATLSALGASFIAYLVGEHGVDDLVTSICAWRGSGRYCGESTSRTVAYIRGWRAFLGVEPE